MADLAYIRFISYLICPRCTASLNMNGSESLYCPNGCRYAVLDGVPQLLYDELIEDPKVAITESFYQAMAHVYGTYYPELDDLQRAERLEFVERAYRVSTNPVVLDLGCGHGRDVAFFRSQRCDVIGIDLSQNMLVLAAARSDACFVRADMRNIPLQIGSVDSVYCHSALYHLAGKHIQRAVAEIARVLKHGGVAYLCLLEGAGNVVLIREEYDNLPLPVTLLNASEVEGMLHSVGFTSIELNSYKYHTKRYLDVTCWK